MVLERGLRLYLAEHGPNKALATKSVWALTFTGARGGTQREESQYDHGHTADALFILSYVYQS